MAAPNETAQEDRYRARISESVDVMARLERSRGAGVTEHCLDRVVEEQVALVSGVHEQVHGAGASDSPAPAKVEEQPLRGQVAPLSTASDQPTPRIVSVAE